MPAASAAVITDSDDDRSASVAPAPTIEEVDLDAVPVPTPENAVRLRVKLPKGPWNLTLSKSMPLNTFVAGVRWRLSREGLPFDGMSLLAGFPPKKIFDPSSPVADDITVADVIRSGDVVTPHV